MSNEKSNEEKKCPSLEDYTKERLQHHVFPGVDAGVAFVPEGGAPSDLQRVLSQIGRHRWYPVPGGHKVLVEYYSIPTESTELFVREKAGWDHEHCDFCGASIPAGGTCWTTPDRNFVVFCEDCYKKVKD